MCFSAEASYGVAVALIPPGAFCVEAAWRKDRSYLPLAVMPVLLGLQQLCEAQVWVGLGREDREVARVASLGFLFFALAVWPVWIPLAVAVVEPRGWSRWALITLAGGGVLFGLGYYLPAAGDGGRGPNPAVVGHSIRYDLSAVPAAGSDWWWVGPTIYLVAVSGPLLAARNRRLRPLGAAVVLSAVVAYVLFVYASASVWCIFAAALSPYLAFVLYRPPGPPPVIPDPGLRPVPSN